MAYNGTVQMHSGFIPQNDGDFPLLRAKDVYIDDDTRLNDRLTAIANANAGFDQAGIMTVENHKLVIRSVADVYGASGGGTPGGGGSGGGSGSGDADTEPIPINNLEDVLDT